MSISNIREVGKMFGHPLLAQFVYAYILEGWINSHGKRGRPRKTFIEEKYKTSWL